MSDTDTIKRPDPAATIVALDAPLNALIGAASLLEIVTLGVEVRTNDYDGLRKSDLAGLEFLARITTDLAETVRAVYDGDGTGWIVGAAFRGVEMGSASE